MAVSTVRRRTLRSQLFLLVLVTLVPMLAFAAAFIIWSAQKQRRTVEHGAIETARALLTAVEREIRGTITALETIATSRDFDRGDLRAVHAELRRTMASQTDWLTMHVASPQGHQLINTLRPYGAPLPGVPEMYGMARVVETRHPAVGDVTFGPVVKQQAVGVRVPVVRGGAVKYVLSTLVPARTFEGILVSQHLPADWIADVLDSRGVHVARNVAPEQVVGQRASDEIVAGLTRAPEGFISARTVEGRRVYAAFSRSEQFGWSVAIGIPAAAVDGPMRRSLIGLGAWALLAAAGAALIATLVGRRLAVPIVTLADATPAIVAGERVMLPASGIVEIDTLAYALEHASIERARAESELSRTSRLLSAVFEGSTDAIFVKDLAGRYIMINPAGAQLIGGSVEDVVGKDDATLFTPESARRIVAQDREIIETGETREFENTSLETTAGVVRTYLSMKAPYRDSEGHVIGVIGITRDFTARRLAEEERTRALEREQAARSEAEVANRAKDEFLAMLSHELRTPLNAVYGWARMLRGGQLDPPTMKRAVEVIERNAMAQMQLIEDLLDISRIITGKMRLDVRPVDLPAIVAAAVDSVRPAADAKLIRLHSVLDPRAPVMGDPDRLQQIVWNLVSNAVKFTSREGRVEVALRRANSHVEIIVSDTGKGITPAVLPYIFDRFRQGDSTSTRTHGGLGLGLALVRHLTELHGGTASATSAGEGMGATFVVKLPIAIVRTESPSDTVHPTAPTRVMAMLAGALDGIRVLVVDDDVDALDLVAAMLPDTGAETRTCASAAEAMALMRTWRPDVLLSDLEMPGEDGYALLRRVQALERETGRRIPAVALTAYGRIEDRVRTLSAGFAMHLPKPVDPAELVAVIGALVLRR